MLTTGAKADLGNLQLSRLQTDPDTGEPILTGVVRGTITDRRTGLPLSGAVVSVAGSSLSATTNSSGEYQLSAVPEGSVQLNVSAAGYGTVSGTANLAAGQTLIFSPALQEQVALGVLVQGTITDRLTSLPLAGVQIQITGGDNQSQTATTDASGNYSISNIVAGTIALTATATDYHPVSATTTVEDGAQLIFSPQLDLLSQNPEPLLGGLTGVVVDAATGRGLELAQVTLTYSSGETFTQPSGQDGEFTFNGLPQGAVTVTVTLTEYASVSGSLDTQPGLVTNIGSIELQPDNVPTSGDLSGFVVDVRTQNPINGALISARNTTNNSLTEVMADAQGVFTLSTLAADEYEITVSFTDYNSQVFTAIVSAGNTLDLGEIRLRQPGVDALLADVAITELDNIQVESSQTDFAVSGMVSGVMVNRGNIGVAVPFDVVAFEDTNSDGLLTGVDTELGRSTLSFDETASFAVDSAVGFTVNVSGLQSFHDAPIAVMVDGNNVIAELSEANNVNSTAGLCTNQQQGPSLDLAICMDSSGSVSSSEFQLQLEGTARAIENEDIIPRDGSVRVSVIQFASSSSTELNPTIIEEDNASQIADVIRAIRKRGGGTSIHACIDTANNLITNASPVSALQVIDVSTDGRSNQSSAVAASNRAMLAGIDVLNSIGVGSGIDINLLNNIVFPQPSGGDRGFVITVGNFQEYIDGIASKIQRETRIPDFTIGGLALTDNGNSADASALMIIGNGGSGDISGAVIVRLYNGSPDQGGQLLAEQRYTGGLLSGESTQIAIDSIVPATITAGEVVVEVTLEEGFAECNQGNNRQQVAVMSLLGDVSLTLNGSVFASDADIDLATQVLNNGSLEGNYTVALSILDTAGIEVANVAAFDVTTLPPTETISFSNLWNTGVSAAGSYTAQATLLDLEGNELDTAQASFTISDLLNPDGTPNGTPAASVRAATDRPFYHVDDEVRLDALAENITTIHPIDHPELLLQVANAEGTEVFTDTVVLASLAPSQIAQAVRALTLSQAIEGTYNYQLTLQDNNGETFATALATFDVVNDLNAAVTGSVVVQHPELFRGDTQMCAFATQNTGTQDITDLGITYKILNIDFQQEVTDTNTTQDIAAGSSANQVESLATTGFIPGNYACALEATLDGQPRVLAYGQFTVVEPPINIVSDLQLSSSPRLLILVDPLQDTCTANRSVTFEGEFSSVITDNTGIYAKVYGQYGWWPKDYEFAKPADFTGESPIDEANNNHGYPDIAITALSDERIQVTLSDNQALKGRYRIAHYVKGSPWHPKLETDTVDFTCGTPLQVGQIVGELTVVATEDVELLASQHQHNHHGYGHHQPQQVAEAPLLASQYDVLGTLLAERSYVLVDNIYDFKAELLSGQYQQYLLLHERQSLDHITAKLLREAINRGEGIVFAGGRAPASQPLWEALGIRPAKTHHKHGYWQGNWNGWGHHSSGKSRQLQAEGIQLLETPLATASDVYFGLDRSLSHIDIEQANLAGILISPEAKHKSSHGAGYKKHHHQSALQHVPGATYGDYGRGKAVFIGYDLLAEITQAGLDSSNPHVNLLQNSLVYTTPDALPQREGGVVSVQITLDNEGNGTPVTVTLQWPADSQLIDSYPLADTEQTTFTWAAPLAVDEDAIFTGWAIPRYIEGNAEVIATIDIGEVATDQPYQQRELTLESVPAENVQAIQQALATLISQSVNHHQKHRFKKAKHWLYKAAHFYQKGRGEKALSLLLYATNELVHIDTQEAIDVRLRVDELLWQWGQQLSNGGQP